MRPQPLIVVRDVEVSSRFYRRVLGCESGHGPTPDRHSRFEYERLVDPRLHHTEWGSDGLILQLHAWDVDHQHGPMADPDPTKPLGNGVLLWFEVDDFDAAVARAREVGARIVRDVHVNPNPQHRELWIADPDGYLVVIASPDGEAIAR